jgi:hypothetical protein
MLSSTQIQIPHTAAPRQLREPKLLADVVQRLDDEQRPLVADAAEHLADQGDVLCRGVRGMVTERWVYHFRVPTCQW